MNWKDVFKTEDGDVVIGQKPNLPLLIAIFFYLVRFLPFESSIVISKGGGAAAMIYWSYLEIVSGVNLFRRLLGLIVFGYILFRMLLNSGLV